MKRDRKIQRFFTQNCTQLDDGRQFMESLNGQIDLLPTPASMIEEESLAKADLLRRLRAGIRADMIRSAVIIIGTALAVISVLALLYVFVFSPLLSDLGYYVLNIGGHIIHLTKVRLFAAASLVLAASTLLVSLSIISRDDIF